MAKNKMGKRLAGLGLRFMDVLPVLELMDVAEVKGFYKKGKLEKRLRRFMNAGLEEESFFSKEGVKEKLSAIKDFSFSISGEIKEYLKIADSGNERVQGFCGNCGSQIYAADPAKTLFMVRTGCLSQHDQLVPAKHIFGKSAASWLSTIEDQQWVTEGPASAEMTPPGRT